MVTTREWASIRLKVVNLAQIVAFSLDSQVNTDVYSLVLDTKKSRSYRFTQANRADQRERKEASWKLLTLFGRLVPEQQKKERFTSTSLQIGSSTYDYQAKISRASTDKLTVERSK